MPEDLAELRLLEDRLLALTHPLPIEVKFAAEFSRKAWRRDLRPAEVEMLSQPYRSAAKPNASIESAMKALLLALLMST